MPWDLSNDKPIYLQLMDKVIQDILAGVYPPGGKLPSVRDLACIAEVNPNTMQKALSELERSGLIYSQRTSGRFITEDITMIQKAKRDVAYNQVRDFLEKMKQSGFEKEKIIEMIHTMLEEDSLWD